MHSGTDIARGRAAAATIRDAHARSDPASRSPSRPERKRPMPGRLATDQLLDLLAVGLRNHAIAERLGLSEKTVRNHVSTVLLKLQVPDRTAAALKAREAGLGGGDP